MCRLSAFLISRGSSFHHVGARIAIRCVFYSRGPPPRLAEVVPEHEIAEEGVTLAHPEVVEQGLGHVAGVLEEAGEHGEHLHNLQRRQILRLLHVLHTCAQAFLLCGRRAQGGI